MKPGLDRADRDLHGFRDLAKVQIVNEPQQEGFAVLLRKMSESGGQSAFPGVVRVEGGKRLEVVLFSRCGLVTRRLSSGRNRKVLYGGVKERLQIRGQHKAWELLQKIEEGFLQHVESEVLVARKAVSETHNPVTVAPVQHFKRSVVTVVDGGNQVEVALGIALQAVSPSGDAKQWLTLIIGEPLVCSVDRGQIIRALYD